MCLLVVTANPQGCAAFESLMRLQLQVRDSQRTSRSCRTSWQKKTRNKKTTTLEAVFKNAAAERLFSVYGGCKWSRSPRFGSPAMWDRPRHPERRIQTPDHHQEADCSVASETFSDVISFFFFFFYPATDDIALKHSWKYLNGTNSFLILDKAGANNLELCDASLHQELVWLLSNKGGKKGNGGVTWDCPNSARFFARLCRR